MNFSEDEIIERKCKKCGRCNPNMLIPYEFEFTCISCGYTLFRRAH